MSDIKIQPSATGSATVTLTAPATGTARTVTLPDSTDTLAVNSDVTNKLPLAGGTMTGTIAGFTSTGIDDNATETAITITSAETVGVGIVPEATYSTWTALQVGGTGNIFTEKPQAASAQFCIGQNVYMDAAGDFTYMVTDEASYYRQYSGTHRFFIAGSGSADSTISAVTGLEIKPAQSGTTADVSMGAAWSGDGGGKTDFQTGTNDGVLCRMSSSSTASKQRMWFVNANGLVGSVSTSGSSTVFATSSDYRIKENVDYTWDATTRLKQLKPARFNFIADDTTTVDGFLAHEVATVVPDAVTGTKDAMRDEEYEVTPAVMDGETVVTAAVMGTRSIPDIQGIDQSKLVPLLVKTIQELEARITTLEG
jgi:hypothetical protein